MYIIYILYNILYKLFYRFSTIYIYIYVEKIYYIFVEINCFINTFYTH